VAEFCVVKLDNPTMAANGGEVIALADTILAALDVRRDKDGVVGADTRIWRAYADCKVGDKVRMAQMGYATRTS